ncbi:hypothetical protein UA08_02900 [Talaromyces atroroseus]|uniref:Uncharacterized protein n=1 Tax=Talaromyces atroroseus TaxID=1441469 RepID=A0A225B384_TALAT|nr:hypothetical protein UA08_02900 [Talaromyces atroroseus]OKL61746.1 hypothetical protein UA08_02900 [Talaromyces atroroseus]
MPGRTYYPADIYFHIGAPPRMRPGVQLPRPLLIEVSVDGAYLKRQHYRRSKVIFVFGGPGFGSHEVIGEVMPVLDPNNPDQLDKAYILFEVSLPNLPTSYTGSVDCVLEIVALAGGRVRTIGQTYKDFIVYSDYAPVSLPPTFIFDTKREPCILELFKGAFGNGKAYEDASKGIISHAM